MKWKINSQSLLILTEHLAFYITPRDSQNDQFSNLFQVFLFTQIYNDASCIYKLELMTLEYFLHEATMSPLEDLGGEVLLGAHLIK